MVSRFQDGEVDRVVGVIQKTWQPQNSGNPPKDLFFGGILDVHFISFYHYLAGWESFSHFFCEEGSGKYGWLYGILGWLRVKYPNVRVIGTSTYLSMKLIQWCEIPRSQLGLGLWFPSLPLFLLQGCFFWKFFWSKRNMSMIGGKNPRILKITG